MVVSLRSSLVAAAFSCPRPLNAIKVQGLAYYPPLPLIPPWVTLASYVALNAIHELMTPRYVSAALTTPLSSRLPTPCLHLEI